MSEDRAARLAAIAEQIKVCQLCRLHEKANNPVPGYGDFNAEIIFIGEAPGEQEDKQGLPFVGRSGKYLDYLLNLIGLKREQVFIANVIKHRPPDNRDPLQDELDACKPYLDQQLQILDPLVIATLGRFSMARYFPKGKISQIHGQPRYADSRAYFPMFHPAAALRNPELRWDMEADIQKLPLIIEEVKRLRAGGTVSEAQPTPSETPQEKPPKTEPEDDGPPVQLSLF